MTEEGLPCDFCGKLCTSWCKVCHIYYCSTKCQKDHWRDHKKICAPTIAKRLRLLRQLEWKEQCDHITVVSVMPTKVTFLGIQNTPVNKTTWSSSVGYYKARKSGVFGYVSCIGCGITGFSVTSSRFHSSQIIVMSDYGKRMEVSYCLDCHEQTRFVDPVTLMTMREIWIVFVWCWQKCKRYPKDILKCLLPYVFIEWTKRANVSLCYRSPFQSHVDSAYNNMQKAFIEIDKGIRLIK